MTAHASSSPGATDVRARSSARSTFLHVGRVRTKLFLVLTGLSLFSLLGADVLLVRSTRERVTALIRSELVAEARLVAHDAERYPDYTTAPREWSATTERIGHALELRVTLVRSDGVVLGDSEVPFADLGRVENHARRPEVETALAGGIGEDTRTSATVHAPYMYVALPFARSGQTFGAVRVAKPLDEVGAAVANVHRGIGFASAAALIAATIIAFAMSSRMAESVERLRSVATRIRAGDLEARTHVETSDELSDLGDALEGIAANLSTTMTALHSGHDLLARVLESMKEGVLVLDGEDRLILANSAARDMLSLGREHEGRQLLEVIRHADLFDHMRAARSGDTRDLELDGIPGRRLLVRAVALEGIEDRVLGVFADVTDLRRLETMRRDFVANVSHELRTPVAALLGAVETLRDIAPSNDSARQKFLDIIERNGIRLKNLVQDLLELSRLDAQKAQADLDEIDVRALVELVVGWFQERARERKMTLAMHLPASAATVRGHRRSLEQVVANLVDNALKYGGEGGRIMIATTSEGEHVILTVQDSGPGIAEEHLPRLFERFYRVDAGRSRDVGGTGLGLAIVKHLVEAMGGSVSVSSEPTRGTTFTVKLRVSA